MNRTQFREISAVCGRIFPYRIMKYTDIPLAECLSFMSEQSFSGLMTYYSEQNAGQTEKAEALLLALRAVKAVPELALMTVNAAFGFVCALSDGTAGEINQMCPDCLDAGMREYYGLIFALVLSLVGEKEMEQRKIPEQYWMPEHRREIRSALKRYFVKGVLRFPDYQWSLNFFGCGIFQIGRFLFIPYRWEETPFVYRNMDGKNIALWADGEKIRRDGQPDGVNGIFDEYAFTSYIKEETGNITAYPVNAEGYVETKPVSLAAEEWTRILSPGDFVIALHIPDGEGYDPEHLYASCAAAIDFFCKFYSEYSFKAFQSESWLFDPAISALLGPDRRISRVKHEFYCYPTSSGEKYSLYEVFGTVSKDLSRYPTETSLQRLMLEELRTGRHFHVTGAFLLFDDVKKRVCF